MMMAAGGVAPSDARRLVDAASDAVIGFDLDGRVRSWNRAAEQLLLWPAADAVGRVGAELVDVEPAGLIDEVRRSVAAGHSVRGDYVLRRRDGSRVEVEVCADPVRSPDGQVVAIAARLSDVTTMRAEQRELAQRAQLVDAVPDALMCTDVHGVVTYWSAGAEKIYGRSATEVVGRPLATICSDAGEAARLRQRVGVVTSGAPLEWTDTYHRRRDGSVIWTSVRARPLRSGSGVIGMSMLAHDVTSQRTAELEIERLSWQDPLTALPNRQALLLRLSDLAAERVPAAVALLDLDHLSLVNDTYGHDAGDRLLRLLADRLRVAVGPEGFLARIGGDEFAVVLREPAGAVDEVNRLLTLIGEPLDLDGTPLLLSASAGLVLCPPTPVADALRHADASMYEAKRLGRARLHVFDASVVARAESMLKLSSALRRALHDDAGELAVHYQPIVDLASDRLVALEALARWHSAEFGPIPPGRFVDVAEHTGLGARLDLWTMAHAFADYASLVAGRVIEPDVRISVNVSASHLLADDVADAILLTAYDCGVSPRQIMLEVTEDALLRDVDATAQALTKLRAQGVLIAVDDFGTGPSSLAALRRLPVDALKIDRAFVRNVTEAGSDLAIVAALVDLAHALGVDVIAEGVETPEQRRRLAELKCEQAQGYLWSAPVPRADLTDALHDVMRRGRTADAVTRLRPREAAPAALAGREHGLLRMLELQREGNSPASIAAALNAEGFRTPEGLRWHRATVAKALAVTGRP